jgi:hypothetical protein
MTANCEALITVEAGLLTRAAVRCRRGGAATPQAKKGCSSEGRQLRGMALTQFFAARADEV